MPTLMTISVARMLKLWADPRWVVAAVVRLREILRGTGPRRGALAAVAISGDSLPGAVFGSPVAQPRACAANQVTSSPVSHPSRIRHREHVPHRGRVDTGDRHSQPTRPRRTSSETTRLRAGLCLVPGDRAGQAAVLDALVADNITL